jgi:dolichyl-phosphate-mannose--protein O-mannosyl transferase
MLPFIPDDGNGIPHCIKDGLVSRIDPDWEARHKAASIAHRIFDLFLSLPQGGNRSRVNQTFASRWGQLPLFTGPSVPYWTRDGKHILCMGNVLLWWPVVVAVIANVLRVLATREIASETSAMMYGYILSYVPLLLVTRTLFVSHYAIPLIFGCLNLGVFIDRCLEGETRGFAFCLVATLAVVGYFLWSPLVYGLTVPDLSFLLWNRHWIESSV